MCLAAENVPIDAHCSTPAPFFLLSLLDDFDALDDFSGRTNHDANLFGIDLDSHDFRSKRRDFLARTVQLLEHFTKNVDSSFFGLLKSAPHQLTAQTGDLDVHLQSGNPFLGSGDLVLVCVGLV